MFDGELRVEESSRGEASTEQHAARDRARVYRARYYEALGREDHGTAEQQELHRRFVNRRRQRGAWDAEEARDLREAVRLRVWEPVGCANIIEYLERYAGMGARVAHDRLRVSEALGRLPMMEAALGEATLSYSHVRELTRIATPGTEAAWIEVGAGMTVTEVMKDVSGRVRGDEPGDRKRPELAMRTITFRVRETTAARFTAIVRDLERQRGERFEDDEERVAAVSDAIETRAFTATASDPPPSKTIVFVRPPTQVWLTNDGRAFAHGVELAPEEAGALTCDATEMGHVDDPKARKKTAISRRQRERVMARDGFKCTVPGCNCTDDLQLHHLRARAQGGDNSDSNLTTVCGGHHRRAHEGRLDIAGAAPHDLRFRRPIVDGSSD